MANILFILLFFVYTVFFFVYTKKTKKINVHLFYFVFFVYTNIRENNFPLGACRNLFLGVFLLFLAKFMLQSSFFSESRLFTRWLFCFFVPDLDWLAGQPIQIFFAIQIFVLFCFRFLMYSSVGSILWEATVGKLVAGEVVGWG